MKIPFQRVMCAFTCCLMLSMAVASGDEQQDASRVAAEQQFAEQLTGSVLVGSFTIDGRQDSVPKSERYEIQSLTKATDDLWVFTTRIKYGKVDATLPITVPVVWAGDTPMVSLTDATLPGLGEAFSARVIFHGDRYAGTWQHGKVGGHMFGRIEKSKTTEAATDR